jgi:multidrug efflux pump subunit AcrB
MQPKIEIYRQLVMADPAVQDIVGVTGGQAGTSNAWMMVRLKPLSERKDSARVVADRLRRQMPPVAGGNLWLRVAQDIEMPRVSDGSSYDYMLLASEVQTLRAWAPRVGQALEKLPELVDVDAPTDGGTKQVQLTIDREAARRLGVDMRTITSVLNNSFSQRQISTLYDSLNQYRVIMEADPRLQRSPESLGQIYLPSSSGGQVPLSTIAHFEERNEPLLINHLSQFPANTISFDIGFTDLATDEGFDFAGDLTVATSGSNFVIAGGLEVFFDDLGTVDVSFDNVVSSPDGAFVGGALEFNAAESDIEGISGIRIGFTGTTISPVTVTLADQTQLAFTFDSTSGVLTPASN